MLYTKKLYSKVIDSMSNNYRDNHDFYRYGSNKSFFSFRNYIKSKFIFPKFISKSGTKRSINETLELLDLYGNKLNFLYDNLANEESKNLMIDILAYRILGEEKVKLNTNTDEYWKVCKESFNYADKNDFIPLTFLNWTLYNTDFSRFNIPLHLYTLPYAAIPAYTHLGHYSYSSSTQNIKVNEGDVVLDCGGCYGDTALLFGYYAGGNKGKVYSFEFIPSNIEIFKKNIALNKNISNVEIRPNPLWEKSDVKLFFKDDGPGSSVSPDFFDGANGEVKTISIDDFIHNNSISKVDFIKMDIEGAELPTLKGAIDTLSKHKPKLAISIYHSMDDFVEIPEYLNNLGLGYKFYLGHYTIHAEETVLYAIAE